MIRSFLSRGLYLSSSPILIDLFFLDLIHYARLHTVCSVSSRICTFSLFTIKVLTRLFQVERPHKSFPFSLLPPISTLRGEAECVLEGSIPRQPHHCCSPSYLFCLSPFLLLYLSHPTFIVSSCMPACIYPRLRSTGGSLPVTLWHIAPGSRGNLLLSSQPFFSSPPHIQTCFETHFCCLFNAQGLC